MRRGTWKAGSVAALLSMACMVGQVSAETATYTYDELGRLKTVSWSGGAVVTYSYDANDNRTSVVVTGGQNNNPVATTDTVSTPKNVTLNFDPRSNDTDANGDTLSITAKTNGSHGTVTITGGGTGLSYVPTTNYTGSDSFTYTVSDGHGGTAVGTVNVTVTSNTAPVANNDSVTVTKNVAYSFDPRGNDTDADGDTLSITTKTNGAHGTVTITGGGTGLTFTPTTNYTGSDSFTYTISDGHGGTSTGTVSVTVQAPALSASVTAIYWDADKEGSTWLSFDPNVVCSGSGGSGSYSTYLWEKTSGDANTTVSNSGSASVYWSHAMVGDNTWTSSWRCKVTDSLGATAYSPTVTVTLVHEIGGNG